METNPAPTPDRCRIVLIAPALPVDDLVAALRSAFEGGDVASLILPRHGLSDDDFQALAEVVVPQAQALGVAVMVEGDTRIASRVEADGIHVDGARPALEDVVDRIGGRMMVGAGGAKTRHDALELGEARPDYIFFGRFGYDNKPEAHSRNLGLGSWWAEFVEIPCIVMAGSDPASVTAVAETGADFVAISSAVFATSETPRDQVTAINALLDQTAPRFSEMRSA